ncbi:efflux RND transporter permease subunit [Symbiobacterium thermophilum]|uniref:Multidrug ABC transporter n=1 Tax=Symbiobacterium thermophilum TaxID=2734 RepID=A0A953I789_SYMTR|nr:efflux RND transporter permease subunit [Symbiobacterium thermophilum]MBY6275568.1 multidrug ABC transporter [Symbiobacterium thermophilum]
MRPLIRFSIHHPVPTIVLYLITAVIGLVSLSRLPLDLYPAMEFPLAVVATTYEGAGPEEVEAHVSRPIEEVVGTVPGVTKVRSSSSEGTSLVIVEFDYGTDMDQAGLSIREKVDQVKGYLPAGVGSPMVFKIDPTALPVVTVGVTGSEDLAELKALAEDIIKPRLERLDGVASVDINGGLEREIQVVVDPARLQAFGLSMSSVAQVLGYENLNLPGGQVGEGSVNLLVRTVGQYQSLDEIRDIRLGTVRLGDIAEVRDTFADPETKVWLDGRAAVSLDVQKQSGGNAVAVANAVKAELKKIEADLPGQVQTRILSDTSRMVVTSLESVATNGLQGAVLAILVLLFFLRNLPATFAIAVSIPIAVISTFGPVYFAGITLNIISLGGLSLGVGMMVDNSIVVLENIFRHKEMGKDIVQAAEDGTAEVSLAITASTLTSVAVFLPVVWVTGLAQLFFRELALTISFSLLMSLLTAVTLVPMMAPRLLKDRPARRRIPWAVRLSDRIGQWLERLEAAYGRLLDWALGHRWHVVGIGASFLVLVALVLGQMGLEFIPSSDTSQFRVSIELAPGTRLDETQAAVEQAVAQIQDIPELQSLYVAVGTTGGAYSTGGESNQAFIVGTVSRPGQRRRSLDEIVEDVRGRIVLPGAKVTVATTGIIETGGNDIEVQIKGDDMEVLEDLSKQVLAIVAQVPGARGLDTSISEGRPEVQIRVDRARAARYGLTASQVAATVQSAVRGQVVTQYRVGGEEYDIRLMATEAARSDVNALRQLPIATPLGQTVPLGELAELTRGVGPATIDREDQMRVVKIIGQIYGRDLGSVINDIKARLADFPLPPGYEIAYGGDYELMEEAMTGLVQTLIFSVALVYLVMAAQFESFLHPFVILFSIPLALVGAVLGLVLTGRSMDMSAMIGLILLAGVVVNNAIVLVDYINQLRRQGMDRDEAVRLTGPRRLRPVLMTTLTTVLGLLPLALGLSEGAELEAPLATVVIGGLTLSTLLTLVVIPVVYTLFDDLVVRVQRRASARIRAAAM